MLPGSRLLQHVLLVCYVSPEGSDSASCGKTTASSCASLQHGIDSCGASACGVLVRHGFYKATATTQLRSGVGVYGGCLFNDEADRKYRSVLSAAPAPGTPAVLADGLGASTAFHGIVVLAADAQAGHASIAMAIHASDGLSLTRAILVSGKGGDGTPGASAGQAPQGQGGGAASIGVFSPGGQGGGGMSCQGQSAGGRGGDGAAWQQNTLSGCFLWCGNLAPLLGAAAMQGSRRPIRSTRAMLRPASFRSISTRSIT